jgi:hypothetical protein
MLLRRLRRQQRWGRSVERHGSWRSRLRGGRRERRSSWSRAIRACLQLWLVRRVQR